MRLVLMLRGINLGPTRRVPMAELRTLLGDAGYEDVRTYVQSGNVVLSADATPAEVENDVSRLIEERFGFEVPVIARTGEELAAVVAGNPLAGVATEPRRYQVSFCAEPVAPEIVARLQAAAVGGERLLAVGRELYAWHPEGIARSKMWNALAGTGLGTAATARNWKTVTTLAEMARETA